MTAGKSLWDRLYISTVSADAAELARKYGTGLEIAEFCTAMNMDENFEIYDRQVRNKLKSSDRFVFHAPFNEISPAAIDPKVLELTRERYRQAISIAGSYGIKKLVVHSGYVPLVYFKSWFHDRSVEFWRDFLNSQPEDITICLENVMDDSPELLTEIVKEVNDPRFRLCLDIGHANTFVSDVPLDKWISVTAPYISHLHIHNNKGGYDLHDPLFSGNISMQETLGQLFSYMPQEATVTLETLGSESSLLWLMNNNFLERRDSIDSENRIRA